MSVTDTCVLAITLLGNQGVATIGVLWFYQALETVLMVTINEECRVASGQPPGFENRIFPTSATDVAKNK